MDASSRVTRHLEIETGVSPQLPDDRAELKDTHTLLEHCDNRVDEDFPNLPDTSPEFVARIKEDQRNSLIDLWQITGFERAAV